MIHPVAAFDRIGEENAFAVLARATELANQGRDIINLGIGQPDFKTPGHIVEAAVKALRDGHHGYTPANGLLQAREAVCRRTHFMTGVEISPDSVMIMPGGKPTMYAAIRMLGEAGVDILYPDPGFPIYRSMIEHVGANPIPVPMREENGFAFSAEETLALDHAANPAADPQLSPPTRPAASRPRRRSTSWWRASQHTRTWPSSPTRSTM